MDFSRPVSRPAANEQQQSAPAPVSGGGGNKKMNNDFNKPSIVQIVLFALSLLLVVAMIGALGFTKSNSSMKSVEDERSLVSTDKYQAVFLNSSDGQVYFGKMSILNNEFYRLTDIYYIRVQQQIQPETQANAQGQSSISLAKLGLELHCPDDQMIIPRDKVLYWENLGTEGQVATAIKNYKESDASRNVSCKPADTSSTNNGAAAPAAANPTNAAQQTTNTTR